MSRNKCSRLKRDRSCRSGRARCSASGPAPGRPRRPRTGPRRRSPPRLVAHDVAQLVLAMRYILYSALPSTPHVPCDTSYHVHNHGNRDFNFRKSVEGVMLTPSVSALAKPHQHQLLLSESERKPRRTGYTFCTTAGRVGRTSAGPRGVPSSRDRESVKTMPQTFVGGKSTTCLSQSAPSDPPMHDREEPA